MQLLGKDEAELLQPGRAPRWPGSGCVRGGPLASADLVDSYFAAHSTLRNNLDDSNGLNTGRYHAKSFFKKLYK
jgi:hypothetical protein